MTFPKPLILAMNTDPAIAHVLQDAGYNAEEGTFGIPYRGEAQTKIQPLWDNSYFPSHFTESEIVIIDLSTPITLPGPDGQTALDVNGNIITINTPVGVVDPRPYAMLRAQHSLDRILDYGGLFIIFAEPKTKTTIYVQHDRRSHSPLDDLNNWQFLSVLHSENFIAASDHGTQIQVTALADVLAQKLRRHFLNANFNATLKLFGFGADRWISLATNKFGQTVAGALVSPASIKGSGIFVFPHVPDKAAFILDLIENVLPELYPQLFPFIEETHWIKQDLYQPRTVLVLREEISHVQDEANKKVEGLLRRIDEERASHQYLADLITQTDQALVEAVKKTLAILGFQDVLDYDEELKKRGSTEMREDLHIRDKSPLVLVEVKGVKGTSKEDEALQVTKYLFPRAQELGRTDLRGLSIINHQRHLPPLERRSQPFSTDVLTNAENPNSGFGLLTSWNFYKLAINFIKHGWRHEQISELFNKNGFIEAIPLHYQYIGIVERFAEKLAVVGIQIKEGEVKVGDRIAFELPIEFEEQDVVSLEFENKPVATAQTNMLVGVQTTLSKEQLRAGVRVFRVEKGIHHNDPITSQ